MVLHHYVVVRRDLPLGVVLAQVAHAAGESFYRLTTPDGFQADQTVAVVLGARNEHRLKRLRDALATAHVGHVVIVEVEGEYAGQIMAVGLVPADRGLVQPLLNDFHMLRELAPPGA